MPRQGKPTQSNPTGRAGVEYINVFAKREGQTDLHAQLVAEWGPLLDMAVQIGAYGSRSMLMRAAVDRYPIISVAEAVRILVAETVANSGKHAMEQVGLMVDGFLKEMNDDERTNRGARGPGDHNGVAGCSAVPPGTAD